MAKFKDPTGSLGSSGAKGPPKQSVTCPHCGASHQEYSQARSTFCRSCGKHFDMVDGTAKILAKPIISAVLPVLDAAPAKPDTWFTRLLRFLPNTQPKTIHCFDCATSQKVGFSAKSSTCPKCGAYIDLQDFKILTSFSRNVRTHGNLTIGPKGAFTSSKGHCGPALIIGELSGSLTCSGEARIRRKGRISGALQAEKVRIERKAEVDFSRPIRTRDMEIAGHVTGNILATGTVRLLKTAHLTGSVQARSFIAEKGAIFNGQVTIGESQEKTRAATSEAVEMYRSASNSQSSLEFGPETTL